MDEESPFVQNIQDFLLGGGRSLACRGTFGLAHLNFSTVVL